MNVTKEDILNGLLNLGLKNGDLVEVHSSLSSFGHVDGGANTVIDVIKQIVGVNGTIIMSGFLLSKPLPINSKDLELGVNLKLNILPKGSESTGMGIIVDTFKKSPDVYCGTGMFGLVAWGNKAVEYSKSDYSEIIDKESKSLLLGVSYNKCSSLHLSENVLLPKNLMDFFEKPQRVKSSYPENMFIGYHDTLEEPFIKAGIYANKCGFVKTEYIGLSICRLFKPMHLIEILKDFRKSKPYWLYDLDYLR